MRCCINPGANQASWESTLPEKEQLVPCLGGALLRPAVNKSPGRSIEREIHTGTFIVCWWAEGKARSTTDLRAALNTETQPGSGSCLT